MSTPTIPEAQAAYDRIIEFVAVPADPQTLIDAVAVVGVPPSIVALGNAINTLENAHAAWLANPTTANETGWKLALNDLTPLVGSP